MTFIFDDVEISFELQSTVNAPSSWQMDEEELYYQMKYGEVA